MSEKQVKIQAVYDKDADVPKQVIIEMQVK